jgi:hypothetical protein
MSGNKAVLMWQLNEPRPVKLIVGILAANDNALSRAAGALENEFGYVDFKSDVWPFTQTQYYKGQTGEHILRQFVSIDKLIDPGSLANIKHRANELEKQLAVQLGLDLSRPVNLDPGIIEPSKLVLATTKNHSHRIYIGNKMYAEVTLIYDKGHWKHFDYTYPDYRLKSYQDFFSKVRDRLVEQLRVN